MEVLFICLVVLCIGLVLMTPKKKEEVSISTYHINGKAKACTKAEKIDDLIERLEDIAMELEELRG